MTYRVDRWNVIHMLTVQGTAGALELLKHALKHLPKDILDRLLRQQSKEDLQTVCCPPLGRGFVAYGSMYSLFILLLKGPGSTW